MRGVDYICKTRSKRDLAEAIAQAVRVRLLLSLPFDNFAPPLTKTGVPKLHHNQETNDDEDVTSLKPTMLSRCKPTGSARLNMPLSPSVQKAERLSL
jgi:hypothetical protein